MPSKEGWPVLTSMMILSQIIRISGMTPQDEVGTRLPSSVIADTSMMARSSLPLSESLV
jgi:hypothetical protein